MFNLKNDKIFKKIIFYAFVSSLFFMALEKHACSQVPLNGEQNIVVTKIIIQGNLTVSEDAILNLMSIKAGSVVSNVAIANDIKSIYASNYFQDVRFDKISENELKVTVVEKPTVDNIVFVGFNYVSESSLKDKIVTKRYTIVDEKKLSQDLRTIEQAYIEKGYYLSKASYVLEQVQQGTVNIVFHVKENSPVSIRKVNLLGNNYFADSELQLFMGTRPLSWLSFFTSSGLYKDEFIAGDQQNLTYFYRDSGFAEATVASPTSLLDKSKKDIAVSFYIEEGERFDIGKINFTGDVIDSESEIKEQLSLKEGEIYRISKFNNDMKKLKVIYGDKGYAFAYVYPTFNIDRVKRLYDITYNVTKGEKAYFRKVYIDGNIKTRDNVIRRALKISEGQLYNATNVDISRDGVEKTGFFDNVQLVQEPDQANGVIDVKVIIKEKSTGSLSASIGASPNTTGGGGVTFFGQGQYQERNLIGKAYGLGANVQVSPNPQDTTKVNYSLGLNFTNPSIDDGPWGFGLSGSYSYQVQAVTSSNAVSQAYLTTRTKAFGVNVGRELFIEDLRLGLGYSVSDTRNEPTVPLTAKFYSSGMTEKLSQSISFDKTDNVSEPTSGYYFSATNAIGIRVFNGEYKFGTFSALASYYLPIYLFENFRTNFRFMLQPRFVYQFSGNQSVPYWERLSLGNSYYMKGFSNPGEILSPTMPVTISPETGQIINLTYGGNRSYYGAIEYFVPIIPEAGLRFVAFGEAGTVLDDYDNFSLHNVKYDIGFGFRWKTPVAPFRFEWAFPFEGGQIGQAHFVFTIGTDSFNNGM